MLTKQEKFAIVDVVKNGLIAQGGGSFHLDAEEDMLVDDAARVVCLYRDGKGNACGIGQLISDAAYSSMLEGLSADDWPVLDALRASGMPTSEPSMADFYTRLQLRLHDQILHDWNGKTDALEWRTVVADAADKFLLQIEAEHA